MEFITIILSSLIAIISPVGAIVDTTVESRLRDSVTSIEEIKVRIDNAPSYQILQGKAQRVRIATRGMEVMPSVKLELLEIETDAIHLDLANLDSGNLDSENLNSENLDLANQGEIDFQQLLLQPLNAGIRLSISQENLNLALSSAAIQSMIQEILARQSNSRNRLNYQISDPTIEFLGNNRLRLQVKLCRSSCQRENSQPLAVTLELRLKLIAGRKIELLEISGTINDRPLSSRLLNSFAESISRQLDLRTLESVGITARVLQLDIETDRINLAGFVRVEN